MIYVDEHLAVPICIRSNVSVQMYPFKNSTDVAVAFVHNRFFKAKKQMYGSDWQDT